MTLNKRERGDAAADRLQVSCAPEISRKIRADGPAPVRFQDRLRPPGPRERFDPSSDLMAWLGTNFAAYGDVFSGTAFGGEIFAVNDPELVQHVLRKNWQNYKKGFAIKRIGLLLGNGLMVSEGQTWKTQRKMIQPAFHRSAVTGFRQIMFAANQALAADWISAAWRGETVNITRDISAMALKSVLMCIFGPDYPMAEPHFRILTEEAARNLEFAQAFKSLRELVSRVLAGRKAEDQDGTDILGMLMLARDRAGKPMSHAQVVSEVITLVVAGHETTAATLNWTWHLLAQHPSVEERLHQALDEAGEGPSLSYARQILEEAMRLYPAGWLMTRRALGDDQLGPYFVPKGAEIYISPYFLQRHPALWSDPDRFDPDRFGPDGFAEGQVAARPELAMLAFSAGPRNCIGEIFARMEMEIHVLMVAATIRLRPLDVRQPELDPGVNLRSREDLMMRPELRRRHGPAGEAAKSTALAHSS